MFRQPVELNRGVNFDPFPPVQDQITTLTSRVSGPIASMEFREQSHLFVELSCLAYFDFEGASKWSKQIGFQKIVKVGAGGHSAYVLSTETDLVIAFKGTESLIDVKIDLDIDKARDGDLPGKVHQGFRNSTNLIWPKIEPYLDSGKKVWLTGHSLGGAMAAIVGVRAARGTPPNVEAIFSFGQPRVGTLLYVANTNTPHYRWVNHLDIVARLPTKWMGFQHFGSEQYIDEHGHRPKGLWSKLKRLLGRILDRLTLDGVADHNIVEYRTNILRFSKESMNGER